MTQIGNEIRQFITINETEIVKYSYIDLKLSFQNPASTKKKVDSEV